MILIEIILTVVAWTRGWKWLSLIPIGSAFLIGVLILLSNPHQNPYELGYLDIFAMIALIIMIFRNPKNKTKKQ